MCGLFGYVATEGKQFDPKRMATIAKATEARGHHAFGFAWIDSRGRLRMFKRTGRISDYIGCLSMAKDARMLVGHCRYATHGRPENNLNNHPHPCDGGWLVHNGIIHEHEEINEGYMLSPVTNCDSETLCLLVEELDGALVDRCLTASKTCASGPLAMMALWRSPMRLVALRANNQPLHIGANSEGTYLASLCTGLPNARSLPNDSAVSFSVRNLRHSLSNVDVHA
jgi:glucosamine 6-phosphate synthetase-like amidotransferase/phosphosugar isomerase protein